jgi:hypothetical protein
MIRNLQNITTINMIVEDNHPLVQLTNWTTYNLQENNNYLCVCVCVCEDKCDYAKEDIIGI